MPHKNIVWINGCFDVLHIGHIKLFQRARQMGFPVIVGIDSDSRIQSMKGNNRPVNSLEDRIEMLRSIKYIDGVIAFSTDEELVAIIKENNPRYMVIGDEYREKKVIGAEHVKELIFVPRYEGFSSSAIINGTHKT